MGKFIRPVGKIIWTGAFAVGLTAVSSLIWGGLLLTNLKTSSSVPWAAGVMAVITWAAYRYFGGKWGPDRTKEARRSYLRAAPVSFALFASTVTAGVLCLVSLSGLWIVLFQLVKAPGNSFGDVSHYPLATVIVSLVVAAVSGAVFEEAGFRGYFQGTLEKYLPGPLAIFVCASVMAPEHAQTQGFVWTTVLFYLVSDVMLGFSAYLTRSIIPGIVIHSISLLTFFSLVWPHDHERALIWQHGPDNWFWVHVAQVLIFAVLGIFTFFRVSRMTKRTTNLARSAISA